MVKLEEIVETDETDAIEDDIEEEFPFPSVAVSGERDTHQASLSAAVTTAIPIINTCAVLDEHKSLWEMIAGIQSGVLYHGVLRINEQNPNEGYVHCHFGIEMVILGEKNTNRALHGDFVAVKPINNGKDDKDGFLDVDEVHAITYQPLVPAAPNRMFGRIVGILTRAHHVYRGSLKLMAELTGSDDVVHSMFLPDDSRIPMFHFQTRQLDCLMKKRLVVVFDFWDRSSQYPSGHCVHIIGLISEDESIELPNDVLRKIFLQLPSFEQLGQLKGVCRSWCAMISDPMFVGEFLCRGNRRILPSEFHRIGEEFLKKVAVFSCQRLPYMLMTGLIWSEYRGYLSYNQRLYRSFITEQFTKICGVHQTMRETIRVFGTNLTGWVAYMTQCDQDKINSYLRQIDGITVLLQQSIRTYDFDSLPITDESHENDLLLRISCRREELEILKETGESTSYQQFVENDLRVLELEYEEFKANKET